MQANRVLRMAAIPMVLGRRGGGPNSGWARHGAAPALHTRFALAALAVLG